jgi:multisubunit Na+/H+ antiporter MnhG subunit
MNYRDLRPTPRSTFSINLYLTTSKTAAYLILFIGSIYSFWVKDGTTLLATFSAVSAILMTKSYTQSKTDQATINSSIQPDPTTPPTNTSDDPSQQG